MNVIIAFLLYRNLRSYTVKNFDYIAVQNFLKSCAFQKCTWLKKSDNAPHFRSQSGAAKPLFLCEIHIYYWPGVCIDTCSTLGICAERNAIFNMITNGEQEIDKVLCILPDGSNGAPCGACRELMVQLMAGKYYNVEIMLDYSTGRIIKLGEITPEWWIK